MATIEEVLAICRQNNRICPHPQQWDALYRALRAKKRTGLAFDPSPPLILSSWWVTSDLEKAERIEIHVRFAASQNMLDEFGARLSALREDEWLHASQIGGPSGSPDRSTGQRPT